jgi:hypothetical protein
MSNDHRDFIPRRLRVAILLCLAILGLLSGYALSPDGRALEEARQG